MPSSRGTLLTSVLHLVLAQVAGQTPPPGESTEGSSEASIACHLPAGAPEATLCQLKVAFALTPQLAGQSRPRPPSAQLGKNKEPDPTGKLLIRFLAFLSRVGSGTMLPEGGGGAEAQAWHLDMQLAGKVVLSVAALLLVTAAYRLYRSRPARAPLWARGAKAEAEEEGEGSRPPEVQGAAPGAPNRGLRRRRGSREPGAPPGCGWESPGPSHILAPGAPSSTLEAGDAWKPERQSTGENRGGRCLGPGRTPPRPGGQEAGTAAVGTPGLPRCLHPGSEPQSCPTGLAVADGGSSVGGEPAPWRDGGRPEQRGTGELESPHRPWMVRSEGQSDMEKSWAFTPVTGVCRAEAGTLQAAADMGLALRQQAGAAGTSYTFSSVARIRVQENFIREKAAGSRPRLQGRVYEYYVESTSQATSRGGPAPRPPATAPAPSGRRAVPGSHDDEHAGEGGAGPAGPCRPVLSPPLLGFSRKESLLQIVENPELQLQPPSCPDLSVTASRPLPGEGQESRSAGSGGEPDLALVAGANFFHPPLSPGSAPDVRLDLGNCYEVLTLAKRQDLEALKEAAYKVMSDNYLHVLRSPDIYGRLSGAERDLILQRRLQGRRHLVVADMCPQEDSGSLCCYDEEQDAWGLLTRLPPEAVSRGCAVCSLFNYVFVVSGCQGPGRRPSNRVFCYNPLTGIWSKVCPLNQARPHCRLVALDGHLYAIGGECLNTVERYDPRLDRWTFAPPLPNDTFALAHTATACAGDIFVTGGTLRYLLLRFSAREQRWQVGPAAGGRDRTAEMVAVGGFLYRFDLNRSLGIGVYRCSASARLWYECATDPTPYPDAFQCAVVDNLVYCVGRQRLLLFLADYVSPRFVPKTPRSFPSPRGTLLPTVLTLPHPRVPQTRV